MDSKISSAKKNNVRYWTMDIVHLKTHQFIVKCQILNYDVFMKAFTFCQKHAKNIPKLNFTGLKNTEAFNTLAEEYEFSLKFEPPFKLLPYEKKQDASYTLFWINKQNLYSLLSILDGYIILSGNQQIEYMAQQNKMWKRKVSQTLALALHPRLGAASYITPDMFQMINEFQPPSWITYFDSL